MKLILKITFFENLYMYIKSANLVLIQDMVIAHVMADVVVTRGLLGLRVIVLPVTQHVLTLMMMMM